MILIGIIFFPWMQSMFCFLFFFSTFTLIFQESWQGLDMIYVKKKSKYFDKKKTNAKTSLASPTASKHFLKIIYSPPIKESKCPELLCASYLTLQKFGMWDQINCQEKRFKICHILYIRKPKVTFSIFHFVLLIFSLYVDQGIY